jgi:hypothetical protein
VGTFGQKTEGKTPATVRGLYMGENRKADRSPTLQLAKGGRKQAGKRIFAWASE